MSFKKNLKNFSSHFSFVSALKIVDKQMLFWSIFFQCTTKKLLTTKKNGHISIFDG